MNRALSILAPLALLAILLAAWELHLSPPSPAAPICCRRRRRSPSPRLQNLPLLASAAWNTLSTALLALVWASLLACLLAMVVAINPLIEQAVRPLVTTLQVTPIVAIAPLVTIWAGLDHPERAILALAVVVAFFPIFSGCPDRAEERRSGPGAIVRSLWRQPPAALVSPAAAVRRAVPAGRS